MNQDLLENLLEREIDNETRMLVIMNLLDETLFCEDEERTE